MSTKDATPAQLMATRLHNLAEHLEAHPHLVPVVVHGGHEVADLQIGHYADRRDEALLAWADSMVDVKASMHLVGKGDEATAYVDVVGLVGGRSEKVWTALAGLREFLVGAGLLGGESRGIKDFDLAVLREFAESTGDGA